MSGSSTVRWWRDPWRWGCLVAGAVHTASFAPLGGWPLQVLALAALVVAVRHEPPRTAAWRGWCFGLGWLSSGLWWLYISMHDFGGLPAVMAGAAVLLLAAALSLYPAVALWAWARWRTGRDLADGVAFAAWWLLSELARAQWLTGFPWIASGYAHTDGPLALLAPWIGVYGIGAVAALLAATLGLSWHARRLLPGLTALALALPLAAAVAPHTFTEPTGVLRVSLLQPNVPQDVKFDPEHILDNMQALLRQLHAAQGDLVVTPESVLPVARDELPPGYWATLTMPFRQGHQAALIGTFLGNETQGYVNSLVGVAADRSDDYAYGKHHLLPFGEIVPPGFHWLVALMQIPLSDQAAGTDSRPFVVAGQRVRPLICYEDLFGEDFADSMVGPQAATVLINVSNLAWFGQHMIQDQHLQFSRMRALEFQRPLARATNTGATALVDHQGQVVSRWPAWTTGTLEVQVQGRLGTTPYAAWLARTGLWPLWALALALAAATGIRRRRT